MKDRARAAVEIHLSFICYSCKTQQDIGAIQLLPAGSSQPGCSVGSHVHGTTAPHLALKLRLQAPTIHVYISNSAASHQQDRDKPPLQQSQVAKIKASGKALRYNGDEGHKYQDQLNSSP